MTLKPVNQLERFYDNHDKIVLPLMFYIGEDGKINIDEEEMHQALDGVISQIEQKHNDALDERKEL